MGVSGDDPAAELATKLKQHAEANRHLAIAILALAESGGMPDSYWATDSRVRLAIETLWPGSGEWSRPPSRVWVLEQCGL